MATGGRMYKKARRLLSGIIKWIPLSPFSVLFFFIQAIFYLKICAKGISGFSENLDSALKISVFSGLIFSVVLGEFLSRIFHRQRRWSQPILLSILGFQLLLGFYHIRVNSFFDLAIFVYNAGAVFSPRLVFEIVAGIYQVSDWVLIPLLLMLFSRLQLGGRSTGNIRYFSLSLLVMVVYLYSGGVVTDEIGHVVRSGRGLAGKITKCETNNIPNLEYKRKFLSRFEKPVVQPDVYLIMVESFNANFVEHKEDGKSVTPFFDSLIPEGVYVEKFYGNSVQTSKGHISTLCSVYPSLTGKIMKHFPGTKLSGIGPVLEKNGYQTSFYKAAYDIHYDNTYEFMQNHGYDIVRGMDSELIGDVPKKYKWKSWGLQENVFFKKVFSDLDAKRESGRPVFTALTTVTTHMWFKGLPAEYRRVRSNPSSLRDHYMNSLAATDEWLKTFFDELRAQPRGKNAIVIITGDHSFPMGEQGNFSTQTGFYESNFRIPLLILWPDHLNPERIRNPFSQVDIAPTLFDMLGISGEWALMGNSIFAPYDSRRSTWLIQPYNGLFTGIVRGQMKYVYGSEYRREYLFDLSKDPLEQNNLLDGDTVDDDFLIPFRKEIRKSIQHHFNILGNRILD